MNIAYYRYVGPTFNLKAGVNKIEVKEKMVIGLTAIRNSKDMWLRDYRAPNIAYRITQQRASRIVKNSKLVRVPQANDRTEQAAKIIEQTQVRKFDADRYVPVERPANELTSRGGKPATGVITARCQWRILMADTEVQTNKETRVLKFKKRQVIGMRFTSPSKGGLLVTMEGVYEPLSTEVYDGIVQASKVLPKDKWFTQVIPVETVAEYRRQHDLQRIKERNAVEKQERQEDAVHREQIREAKQGEQEQEHQVVKDGKEYSEIAKEVAEGAKVAEATAKEKRQKLLAEQAAALDQNLRSMKAGKMDPSANNISVEHVDDVDAGDDVESEEQAPQQVADPVVEKQLQSLKSLYTDEMGAAQRLARIAAKTDKADVTKGLLNHIRDAYNKAVAAIKTGGGIKIVDAFSDAVDKMMSDVKAALDLDAAGVPKENGEVGDKVERKPVADTDEESKEEVDDADADTADEEVDDGTADEEVDDGTADEEVDEEVDDADADDEYDSIDDEADHSKLVDGDTEDEEGDDLNQVDEEEGTPDPTEDEPEDQDIDDATSGLGSDDSVDADEDEPEQQPEEEEDAEVGDIVVFHDDKKLARKYVVLGKEVNAKSKDVMDYTVWSKSEPDEYRVIRCSTKHGQHLGNLVDITGRVSEKSIPKLAKRLETATQNTKPIKS